MKNKAIALLFIGVFLLAFSTCKKDTDVNMESFKIVKEVEKVTTGTTTATITGMYDFSGRIDGIKVRVGKREELFGSDVFVAEMSGKAYSVDITGLSSGTHYYYRYEVDYGAKEDYLTEIYDFTTLSEAPTVKILAIDPTNNDSTSFAITCMVVDANGGSNLPEYVTECGICWNNYPNGNPTLDDEKQPYTNMNNPYTIRMENLPTRTVYNVKAYAKSSAGTGFSEKESFRTGGETTKPQVSTVEVSNVTYNAATCLCNVSSDGGLELYERGVCWGLETNPILKVPAEGTETGNYTVTIEGLDLNTDYHVRAYAINEKGISYGEDLPFRTTDGKPTVTTSGITEITSTSAKCGGNVTDQGYSPVTERGICWSTSHEPIATGNHATSGTGTGSFICEMTDLTPNQTYYVRAYATNSKGTAYGDEVDFMAMEGLPSVETVDVTNVTTSGAKVNYKVTIEGGLEVDEHGVCWSESNTIPTINDHYVSGGNGTGTFSVDLTGLNPGTKYYVRAYAKNEQGGEAYGTAKDFTTEATLPTVTTDGIEGTTAHGTVTADGGKPVTERGICWGLNHNPTTADLHDSNGTGLGSYAVPLTDLQPGKTYYYRAYATNEMGTAYGLEGPPLVVEANPPTVNTGEVSNIQQTTAQGSGNVTDGGGAEVTERGVCWSTSPNPTIANSHADDGVGGLGNFTVPMTGLTANTHYYVRAYAKNREGKIGYGNQTDFTTAQSISAPTVTTTSPITNITQTTATGGGNVTNDGGSPVTERGICWSTSHNPTISGSHSSNGTGTGAYQVNMTGLTPGTTYYVRAYAKNNANLIGYGTEVQFTTQQQTTYTITVSANPTNGGTVNGGGTYNHGQSCTVTADDNPGYTFLRWTENGTQVSTNASYTFTVTGPRTLVAQFQQQTYTITATANPTNGGTATVSGNGTFTYNQQCTLTATPNSHYSFTNWKKGNNVVSPNAIYTFNVTESASYTANFTQDPQYTITATANPTNGGTVTGGGTYYAGTTVNLIANANSGFTFDHWQDGNTNNPRTITVTGNATYTAYFEAQPQAPEGAINGQFTINANGDKVYFSKGNLQYQPSTSTWQFAENQWDLLIIPEDMTYFFESGGNYYYYADVSSQYTSSYSGWIDLFGWGTSGWDSGNIYYHPWDSNNNINSGNLYGPPGQYDLTGSYSDADWGVHNAINNGGDQASQWRTLTGGNNGEWEYIFNTRNASTINGTPNARYAKAKVANVHGVILFPDSYTHPSGVVQPVGINGNTGWNGNSYDVSDFMAMQAAGAVFLPAAGTRNGSMVLDVGSHGGYWSASCSGNSNAYYKHFNSSGLHMYGEGRSYGRSVRLVRTVQ